MTERMEELLDLALVTIAAAIVYAGDGLEAALIARGIEADGETWTRPESDGATPRITEQEAVSVAVTLLAQTKYTLGLTGEAEEAS